MTDQPSKVLRHRAVGGDKKAAVPSPRLLLGSPLAQTVVAASSSRDRQPFLTLQNGWLPEGEHGHKGDTDAVSGEASDGATHHFDVGAVGMGATGPCTEQQSGHQDSSHDSDDSFSVGSDSFSVGSDGDQGEEEPDELLDTQFSSQSDQGLRLTVSAPETPQQPVDVVQALLFEPGDEGMGAGPEPIGLLADTRASSSGSLMVTPPPPALITVDVLDEPNNEGANSQQNIVLTTAAGESIHIADVIGISFQVYAEAGRKSPEGEVLIVRRGRSLTKDAWKHWVKMIFLSCMLFVGLSHLVGPVTAAVMFGLFLGFRKELLTWAGNEVKRQGMKTDPVVLLSKVCISSIFYILSMWVAPAVAGWTLQVPAMAVSFLIVRRFHEALHQFMGFERPSHTPIPTYPISVRYLEQDIPQMLELRRTLWSLAPARQKLSNIIIGSYWVEAISSVLLYHDIYNSGRARFVGYVFYSYILPVIFALQVFGVASPWLTRQILRLQSSVRADLGVRIGQFVAQTANFNIPIPDQIIYLYDTLSTPVLVVSAWCSTVARWLMPFDEGLTYIRAKMQPILHMLLPLQRAFSAFTDVIRAAGASISGPVSTAIRLFAICANALRNLNRTVKEVPYNPSFRRVVERIKFLTPPRRRSSSVDLPASGESAPPGTPHPAGSGIPTPTLLHGSSALTPRTPARASVPYVQGMGATVGSGNVASTPGVIPGSGNGGSSRFAMPRNSSCPNITPVVRRRRTVSEGEDPHTDDAFDPLNASSNATPPQRHTQTQTPVQEHMDETDPGEDTAVLTRKRSLSASHAPSAVTAAAATARQEIGVEG